MSSLDRNHPSTEYEKLDLKTFKYTEYKSQDIENDIDPENNFYKNIYRHCEYHTEDQFIRNIKMDGEISIIHFNSRSLSSNFAKINYCLRKLHKKFTIIAIAETWLCDELIKVGGLHCTLMKIINVNLSGICLLPWIISWNALQLK